MSRPCRLPFRPPAATSIALSIAASLLACGAFADTPPAGERLEAVRERIEAVAAEIERQRDRRDDLTERLAAAEREIGRLGKRLHDMEGAIRKRERGIETLRERAATEARQLAAERRQLAAQVRSAYAGGRQGKLRLLLSGRDPATLGRLLVYHDYYARERSAAIADLREQLDRLATTRRSLAAERDALAGEQAERERALATLEARQNERRATLAKIEQRLAGGGRELESLRADEARLQALVGRLHTELAALPAAAEAPSFDTLKGRLPPPVAGAAIARFGQSKFGGRLRWQGVWLAAQSGEPVQSAAAGRVVYVGWMHRYGLLVVLDHGNGYFTVYGHNQSVYAEVGHWVAAGDTIAEAGRSGGHDRSGVYFEIRKGKTPVNPADWLRS